MDEDLSSKRYEPITIDLNNKNSSFTIIIESTGFNKIVLEIGTSTGYISKVLKERGNNVTGIEIDEVAGSIAQQYCDRMIIGDVETLDLDGILKSASFDVIICGDVLEHLKNPAILLKKLKAYLKPDGYLIVSLPNFCHGDIILNLLNGDFKYTPTGLLDQTHLRFFGLKNILILFTECGYQISDLHTIQNNIGCTEQKVNNKNIPRDLLKFIQSLPNSTVYQFIFIARPSEKIKTPIIDDVDINKLFSDSIEGSMQEIRNPSLHTITIKNMEISNLKTENTNLNMEISNLKTENTNLNTEISNLKKNFIFKFATIFHERIIKRIRHSKTQ